MAATPAVANLAPIALRGLANEASLLKYIPQSWRNIGKIFAANVGIQFAFNGKEADIADAAVGTFNPLLSLFASPVINYKPLAGDVLPTIGADAPEVMAKKFAVSVPFFMIGISMQTLNPGGYNATSEYLLNTAEEAVDTVVPDKKPKK